MIGGGTDPFQEIVKGWGIDLHPDTMAVHDQPPARTSTNIDPLQDAFRRPFIWDLREYGDAGFGPAGQQPRITHADDVPGDHA